MRIMCKDGTDSTAKLLEATVVEYSPEEKIASIEIVDPNGYWDLLDVSEYEYNLWLDELLVRGYSSLLSDKVAVYQRYDDSSDEEDSSSETIEEALETCE